MGSVVLTASDSAWAWSVTGGATSLTAEAIGAGGGGGGVSGYVSGGGGGKGGGYAQVVITKGAESTLNITVGIAGTAGDSAGANGGNGGYSSIVKDVTTVLLASGGIGGAGSTNNSYSGAGATTENGTSIGSTTYAGGNGGSGVYGTPSSGGGGGSAGPSGVGGNASANTAGAHGGGNFLNAIDYCSLGAAGRVTSAAAGITGPGVGAGGSGGLATAATNRAGGAGYRGVVVLTWDDPVKTVESFRCTDIVTASIVTPVSPLSVSSVVESFKHTETVEPVLSWIKLLLSSNIAASAATATTAQLTAPSGKTSGADFQAGKISDDTNPITTDLDSGKYTELEWSLQTQGIATNDEVEFRVTKSGLVLDTYSQTPKITGGTGVTHLSINVSDCTSQETQIGA